MRVILAACAAVIVGGCATAGGGAAPPSTAAPDLGKRVVARGGMVSSAHPLASEAGVEMLRRGGNAVDAAVATAFAVGVVEPQMSGLGGGGAMLIWFQADGRAEYVDFYAAGLAETFRGLPPRDSTTPLRVVGIPGEVAGLAEAHERYGRLAWGEVIAPAIRLAEEGFAVNQILAEMIARDSAKLHRYADARRLFWPDGRPLAPGAILRQLELAGALRRIAAEGRSGFYGGEVAREIVRVLNEGGHPARVEDLARYSPRWRRPLCGDYRGMPVLSAPPPQTGHQIIHTLNLLEPFELGALGLPTRSAAAFDVLTSALRAGMAANRYNDDPAWATVPAAGLVAEAYADHRAGLVGTGAAAPPAVDADDPLPFDDAPPPAICAPLEPYGPAPRVAAVRRGGEIGLEGWAGTATAAPTAGGGAYAPHPGGAWTGETAGPDAPATASQATVGADPGETTHISVVDADGNAVALTQTNSSLFGSGARAAGFFLNNSGFNFERAGEWEGRSPWRVRNSTIAPTIVLDDGRVRMVVGAPGGGRIPTAIVQTMVYHLDYGLDPLDAIRMPRVFPTPSNTRVQLENGFSGETLAGARAIGYEPTALSFGYARLYMIVRRGDHWIGAADPRHNGEPRGYGRAR